MRTRYRVATLAGSSFCLALILILAAGQRPARAAEDAEKLYADNCAVCHGADLGGYIAPALNKDSLRRFSEGQLADKAIFGGIGTLMPPHPTFFDKLSRTEIDSLAALIKNEPQRTLTWNLDDIKASLEILVADEASLPKAPTYPITDIDDLMAVMGRGRYASGDEAKIVFFDGREHRRVGEVATAYAPHLIIYHPSDDRWAYALTDVGVVLKIDLFSLKAVRTVKIGLNSASLGISRDGRYLAAGSFVPNTAVILDSQSLEPLRHFRLEGIDPDGRKVESNAGIIMGMPFADSFVIALKDAGQLWIVDLTDPSFPVTRIRDVGRKLHDAFHSPDGRYLAVASYDDDVLPMGDITEKRVIKRLPAGRQPHVGSGAVIEVDGRILGIGTNIGVHPTDRNLVTVFDMSTFEIVKQIPVKGPTESPAAHPNAPYIVVDVVGLGSRAQDIQLIDKKSLEVVRTIKVGGHSHFPEYTARGDYLYVSAGYGGGKVVVYRSSDFKKVKTLWMEVPAGIFSHLRARIVTIGLDKK